MPVGGVEGTGRGFEFDTIGWQKDGDVFFWGGVGLGPSEIKDVPVSVSLHWTCESGGAQRKKAGSRVGGG